MKCDETRSCCQRCTSTGRKCEYSVSTVSRYDTPLPPSFSGLSPSRVNPSAQRERRAFEYYFYRGASSIAGALDLRFWKGTVLQLSRSEPAVWDAVIAISALYEVPSLSSNPVPKDSEKNEALSWYSRSMMSVRKLIEQNRANQEVAIVTCVLYICIEIMQGHMSEALQLYEQGVSLIYELRAASATSASFLEDTIIPLFFRMGTAALSTAGVPIVRDLFAFADHWEDTGFFTVEAARAALAPLMRETLLFRWEAGARILEVGSVVNVSADTFARQQIFLARLENWYSLFTGLADNQSDHMYQTAISTLRTFHAAIYIILSTCLTQRRTASDNYLSHFRIIVEHASQVLASTTSDTSQTPFTFEAGVGQPLFLTAISCCDPVLRREALELLRRVPQEGFFECKPRVASVEEYIRMEEGRIEGVMVRVSDTTDSMTFLDYSPEDSVENGVREISLERLTNLPCVEDLVTIEDDIGNDQLFSGSELLPIPEGNRIRKNVVVQLNGLSFDGMSQSRPFLHFTRNRPKANGIWEEREYFLPLNPIKAIGMA